MENNQENEVIIIDNIIKELDKKRDIAINKKKKALLKDKFGSTDEKKILLIMFYSEFAN
jgi:hypothetical protein